MVELVKTIAPSAATIAPWITPRICRFAQLCDIGPRDFFRFWHVVSTTQGDVMCWLFFRRKALFWAQISIFGAKTLRFSFFRWNFGKRAWVQGSVEPKISKNGPLQRPTGRFECFSLFSVIFCFFEYVIFIDYFLQILRVLHLRTPDSKAMVCIGTVYTALRRMHVATCSLNKKCFKKHQMTAQETTNKTQIDL